MKKTGAQINISINVECPYCKEDIDIFDAEVFPKLNEEGYLSSRVLVGYFGCEDFDEVIVCPECKKEFLISAVVY